jgi:excisionase family DNA binding protein
MQSKRVNGRDLRLLKVGEVAALLAIHPNTVRRWAAQGLIKTWRVGPRGDHRFDPSDVQALLSSDVRPAEDAA